MIDKMELAQALGVPDVTIDMMVRMDLLKGPIDHITVESVEKLAHALVGIAFKHRSAENRPDLGDTNGYVYLAWCSGTQLVKIGYSVSPQARIRELNTGNADGIRLVLAARGTQADERLAHKTLAEYRVSREWFRPSDALTAFAEALQNGRSVKAACEQAEEVRVRIGIEGPSRKNTHNLKTEEAK